MSVPLPPFSPSPPVSPVSLVPPLPPLLNRDCKGAAPEPPGGRIFFSSAGRTLSVEDQISILTVGIDIGSSTSHLVFSRIVLERFDSRYVVAARETLHESGILLTPYKSTEAAEIDAAVLGEFIARQYQVAGVNPETIDTGALILTGVAARRSNARAIGELFAREAGRMVAVSAGDSLETIMAAHGSGAVARSRRDRATVMNIDIGGGTSKIAICADGQVIAQTTVDVGARLISLDASGRIERVEAAARRDFQIGDVLDCGKAEAFVDRLADRLEQAIRSCGADDLVVGVPSSIDAVTVSGGVAEYFYGREKTAYGDLGMMLAAAIRKRLEAWGPSIELPDQGIRATVIGASQYTTQVSGSTIYVSPLSILPLRNVPVIAPDFEFDRETIDPNKVSAAIQKALQLFDLADGVVPAALFVPWRGPATFARLDAFCRGVSNGMSAVLAKGHPLVLAGDGDVGGLIGVHFHEELGLTHSVVSIDSLELREFDYIDIGAMLDLSGAVPVVIKSLLFGRTSCMTRRRSG
jgi:ethanolamine utilization protein EutA